MESGTGRMGLVKGEQHSSRTALMEGNPWRKEWLARKGPRSCEKQETAKFLELCSFACGQGASLLKSLVVIR